MDDQPGERTDWATVFEAARSYETTVEAVREALSAHRSR